MERTEKLSIEQNGNQTSWHIMFITNHDKLWHIMTYHGISWHFCHTNHDISWQIMTFCHKNKKNIILSRKRAVTTFLPQQFMITRLSIAFEDIPLLIYSPTSYGTLSQCNPTFAETRYTPNLVILTTGCKVIAITLQLVVQMTWLFGFIPNITI